MIEQDKYLRFLDDLRASGVTNMFGAAPYLANRLSLDIGEARTILSYWMDTFAERHESKKEITNVNDIEG